MKQLFLAVTLAISSAVSALADGVVTYTTDESFDDVVFGVESAILEQGLVIDGVSHVGEMLERTKADVGGTKTVFTGADVFTFCSASLSRKVMEADPMNVQFCPYGIFIMQTPGAENVTVGYREYPEGAMKEVEALLETIVKSALGM